MLDGDETSVLSELLALGGSSGGARRKVNVLFDPTSRRVTTDPVASRGSVPVLVKFPTQRDPVDIGAIEHAYANMAVAAGIEVAPTWLLEGSAGPGFFATQRFDRGTTVHVHTLCGLLHADHRVPCISYSDTLKLTSWLTRDHQQVDQTFRRMAFNVLAHNRDDHSRNFAFLLGPAGAGFESARWRISPAYDLTFSEGPGGEHWMAIAGEGRHPGLSHMLAVAREAGVPEKRARQVIDEVRAAVDLWPNFAAAAGVGAPSRDRIRGVLAKLR